jgi:deoxyribose-phosphate aldolase
MGVKASTDIRTAEAVVAMVNAGVCRIGTSHGVVVVSELKL